VLAQARFDVAEYLPLAIREGHRASVGRSSVVSVFFLNTLKRAARSFHQGRFSVPPGPTLWARGAGSLTWWPEDRRRRTARAHGTGVSAGGRFRPRPVHDHAVEGPHLRRRAHPHH